MSDEMSDELTDEQVDILTTFVEQLMPSDEPNEPEIDVIVRQRFFDMYEDF